MSRSPFVSRSRASSRAAATSHFLLPGRVAHWPAVTFVPWGDGRHFSVLRLTAQQLRQGGVGRGEAAGNPVGHRNRLVSNGGTMNRLARRVMRQGAGVFPHGGALC